MWAVIFGNGQILNHERAIEAAKSADLIIAADGGATHCAALGIRPMITIGDLDSLPADQLAVQKAQQVELIQHPADKDETDLELALLESVRRGAARITVLGAAGDRLDMTIANLHLLADPRLAEAEVEIWYANQTAQVVFPPGGPLPGAPGDTISLIPLDGEAETISTHDLQFPLKEETLRFGPARGISNRVSGPQPAIEFHSGLILVVHTPARKS